MSADLKELGRASKTKVLSGKSRAQLGEWAVGTGTSCVGVFAWLGVQSCGKGEFGVELWKPRAETVGSHTGRREPPPPTSAACFSLAVPSPEKLQVELHSGAPSSR